MVLLTPGEARQRESLGTATPPPHGAPEERPLLLTLMYSCTPVSPANGALSSYFKYPRTLLAGNLIEEGAVAVEAGEGGLGVHELVVIIEKQV